MESLRLVAISQVEFGRVEETSVCIWGVQLPTNPRITSNNQTRTSIASDLRPLRNDTLLLRSERDAYTTLDKELWYASSGVVLEEQRQLRKYVSRTPEKTVGGGRGSGRSLGRFWEGCGRALGELWEEFQWLWRLWKFQGQTGWSTFKNKFTLQQIPRISFSLLFYEMFLKIRPWRFGLAITIRLQMASFTR